MIFKRFFANQNYYLVFSILLVHVMFWLFLFHHSTGVIMTFDDQGVSVPERFIVDGIIYSMAFNLLLFYFNYGYLTRKHLAKHLPRYLLFAVIILLVITYGETLADLAQIEQAGYESSSDVGKVLFYFNLKINLGYWLLAAIFKMTTGWFKQIRRQREIKEQQLKVELALLKSQVHPHFLFNTLNTLYASAYEYGDETTADGIGRLSHLLRYMLYETNEQKVPLENEIEYLENYIALQRMRFDEDVDIDFTVSGDIKGGLIAPMLLITLVENAFKHGISSMIKTSIKIHLTKQDQGLLFTVENDLLERRNKPVLEGNTGGLGLANLKKRLLMIYPEQFKFQTYVENNKFFACLELI